MLHSWILIPKNILLPARGHNGALYLNWVNRSNWKFGLWSAATPLAGWPQQRKSVILSMNQIWLRKEIKHIPAAREIVQFKFAFNIIGHNRLPLRKTNWTSPSSSSSSLYSIINEERARHLFTPGTITELYCWPGAIVGVWIQQQSWHVRYSFGRHCGWRGKSDSL